MTKLLALTATLFIATAAHAANQILCLKSYPHWEKGIGDKLVGSMRGPAAIINTDAKRVTWISTGGGLLLLEGESNDRGVKVMRVSGSNPRAEEILTESTVGTTLQLQLQDSLGGTGLMNITVDGSGVSGRAHWQPATDSASTEDLHYCTTNVLN